MKGSLFVCVEVFRDEECNEKVLKKEKLPALTHCAIEPRNILLFDTDISVTLADFELTKIIREGFPTTAVDFIKAHARAR